MSTNPLPPKRLDPETTAAHLFHLRQTVPLVHCLTNQVVQEITANVLLSAGASPAMIIAKEEVSSFVRIASALLVNVGTLTLEQAEVMHLAVDAANRAGVPWVFDPVAAGLIPWRDRMINGLLELKPTVIRGNASEIMALAGAGKGGKGVDSRDSSDAALSAAQNLAATRASPAKPTTSPTAAPRFTSRAATVRQRLWWARAARSRRLSQPLSPKPSIPLRPRPLPVL